MKQSQSFFDLSCADQIHLADRELSALIAAIAETLGVERAGVPAEDRLDELVQLRNWRDGVLKHQTALGTSKAGAEVSPTPSSNLFWLHR